MISKLSCSLMACCLALTAGSAQELKVDINNNNRPISEGNDPSYTSWNDVTAWFPSGANSISKTFNGITVTFTRSGAVGTALKPGYNKPNIQSTSLNVKLTADGITVDGGETGAQIEMRIAGLSAGPHTLAVYHNAWDNLASLAPLNVSVDGVQVATNIPTSINVTENLAAAVSYTTINALAGQDIVVLFAASTSGGEASKNVYINAFEIDTPNPKKLARNPFPANANEHVDADSKSLTLSWTGAYDGTAVSHDVYFGTNSNAVINATHASPEFKGGQAVTNFAVSNLNSLLTYYWRVDEVDNASGVTKGVLWYFRPRQLAFPGAEGYGRFARGGRGGVVVKVTNTNDSGPGSFRDAVLGDYGPRTVIFDVSGQIILLDDVIISETRPYMTIAGQTAPGKGICFRRQQFGLSGARDAIVRHVRVRVGKESGETQNASGIAGCDHTIMDHCSLSWGIDEELSGRGAKNVTFQRSMISEALNIAGHQNYPAGDAHGFAATISGLTGSYHHNLLAHNEGRNWSMGDEYNGSGGTTYSSKMDIFNNVVYNWGGRTTDGTGHHINFVNNYYKPGAASDNHVMLTAQLSTATGTQEFYFAGNVMPGYTQLSNEESGRTYQGTTNGYTYNIWPNAPLFPSYATIDEATNAYKKVLSDVSCNQPLIDDHDIRVIRETIDGTYTYTGTGPYGGSPGLPNTTDDVGGWEDYGNEVRPANFDTDNDGMPNWWELIKGFNTNSTPGDFSESNSDLDGDGFTALEDYLNWLAEPHVDCNAGATVDIDLNGLSRGYTNTTYAYSFSAPVNGSVTLVSNRFARFTPNSSASALASFSYTVTNTGKSYNMTRPINVRVVGSGAGTTNAPAAPTGLNATAGDTQVTLSWDATAEATSYIVKRSTVDGGPYVSIVTNASTSYVNTGLANGTTYYYVVSAVNVVGESPDSAPASATPQLALPGVPAGLSATAGNGQVSLSWGSVAGATGYVVKHSTTSGSGYVSVVTNATASYINTGLTNGVTYYYVVSAVNAAGESGNSTQATAMPQIPAPTGLSATAGNAQVVLSWNASAGATSYVVKRATIGGGPYPSIVTNALTTYTNTGLANGVTYYYVVSALGTHGESGNSAQASATPTGGGSSVLLAYEGFNYAAGTGIAGLAGGLGWGTTWQTGSSASVATNTASGLTYGSLVTSGGALQVGYPQPGAPGGTVTAVPQRVLPTTLGTLAATNGGVLWVSFLLHNPSYPTPAGKYYRQSNLGFFSGAVGSATSGSEKAALGSPNTSATVPANFAAWGGTVTGSAPNLSTVPSFSANVQLVVVKVVVDNTTATDSYYAWINFNPGLLGNNANTPDISTASVTNSGADLSSVNALRFQAGNYNANGTNAFFTADELRLGGSFADVTPVSGTANTAPVLPTISHHTINVGFNLNITNNATDADAGQTLTYSLPVKPVGATISSNVVSWRPLTTQANTTNAFSVIVADNGAPSLSATQSFHVVVNPLVAPTITPPQLVAGRIGLSVSGQVGPDYAIQTSTNLMDWSTLLITNPATVPFTWNAEIGTAPAQFYRIKVGPPLP